VKKYTILVFLFFTFLSWGQAEYSLGNIMVLPVRYYVGDPVEMFVRVSLPEGKALKAPGKLPESSWLEIRDVKCTKIREQEWDVKIHFTAFKPGVHILPDLNLGDIILSGLTSETLSILQGKGDDRLRPLRGQLVLPGTWLKIALALVLIFSMPPFLYLFIRFLLKIFGEYKLARFRILPKFRVSRALKRLGRELAELDPRRFFLRLTRALRNYLTARLAFPADKATTLEIDSLLPVKLPGALPSDRTHTLQEEIVALFRRADHVKFGGLDSTKEEMAGALKKAEGIIVAIEKVEENVEP
jgi:hypothetical protein